MIDKGKKNPGGSLIIRIDFGRIKELNFEMWDEMWGTLFFRSQNRALKNPSNL